MHRHLLPESNRARRDGLTGKTPPSKKAVHFPPLRARSTARRCAPWPQWRCPASPRAPAPLLRCARWRCCAAAPQPRLPATSSCSTATPPSTPRWRRTTSWWWTSTRRCGCSGCAALVEGRHMSCQITRRALLAACAQAARMRERDAGCMKRFCDPAAAANRGGARARSLRAATVTRRAA
jgi:hypothetical protein